MEHADSSIGVAVKTIINYVDESIGSRLCIQVEWLVD